MNKKLFRKLLKHITSGTPYDPTPSVKSFINQHGDGNTEGIKQAFREIKRRAQVPVGLCTVVGRSRRVKYDYWALKYEVFRSKNTAEKLFYESSKAICLESF